MRKQNLSNWIARLERLGLIPTVREHMPTYDYKCTNHNCKDEWESVQRITDEPEEVCPTCGQRTAARLISQSYHDGFYLAGSG